MEKQKYYKQFDNYCNLLKNHAKLWILKSLHGILCSHAMTKRSAMVLKPNPFFGTG